VPTRDSPSTSLRLTDLIGAPVTDCTGTRVGRIADLAVTLDDVFPGVASVLVRTGSRSAPVTLSIAELFALEHTGAALVGVLPAADQAIADQLLLARDVLDVQVIDTSSRRVARVGEVDLAWDAGVLRVIAVDVGWRAILRRLGLRRLARRASRDAIDWAGVHLASGPGHPLQLAAPGAALHRLDADELAELLALLPTPRGTEILGSIDDARAAAALAAVHPDLGADLVESLPAERAAALLAQLPDDEAADALRDADPERRELLLDGMSAGRSTGLRTRIAQPRPPVTGEPRPPRRYWHVLRGHQGFWR